MNDQPVEILVIGKDKTLISVASSPYPRQYLQQNGKPVILQL
jgi:hypothetical protein